MAGPYTSHADRLRQYAWRIRLLCLSYIWLRCKRKRADWLRRLLWLQQLLDLESPQYAHVTVVNDGLGNKLSKQTGAPALVTEHAAQNLRTALSHLKQAAPPDTARRVADILDFATEHWSFPSSH